MEYLKQTHKFGVKLPKTVQVVLTIDIDNRNELWVNEIAKELNNVKVAFTILLDEECMPIGYQKVPCHRMVFDMKMEDSDKKLP
jgi:hypothetical protein